MRAFELPAADAARSRAATGLSLRVYENLDDLKALRPAWTQLLAQYQPATTFCTWEWLSCWWECFGKDRQLLVLALFDANSLVGLAPLSISRERLWRVPLRVLRLMGDGSGDSDNLDLPVQPGFERDFATAILKHLRERGRQWDVCLLNTLPSNSRAADHLAELLKSPSWTFFDDFSKSSSVPLPETWEAYADQLSSEDRKNLTRYARRLQARHTTRIYRCTEPDELAVCLDALFRLHQGRWQSAGKAGSFSSPERQQFYKQLSHSLLARGWLELWILKIDAEIAAVQFAFRYRDKVFQLQEGYDHNRSSDRPGFVLRGAVLQQLILEKVRTYDFLGGEDRYKTRWGAREGIYRQLHFARTDSLGAVWLECLDRATKSKEWLRQKVPATVWRALHRANVALQVVVFRKGEPEDFPGPRDSKHASG